MKRIMIVLLTIAAAAPAAARSWTPSRRNEWRSLDCVKRRLEWMLSHTDDVDLTECIRKTLLHVSPMLDRFGGPIAKSHQVQLDSEDGELKVIMIQHANAHRAAHWSELLNEWWDDTGGRFWRWIKDLFWTSLFWIAVTGALWFWLLKRGKAIKMRDEEIVATHRAIERVHPDKTERSTAFNDPLTARAHRRVKKLLAI